MNRLERMSPTFSAYDRRRMLAAMGMVREEAMKCMSVELPHSPRALKCRAVQDSIDALAADITGNNAFFDGPDVPPGLMMRLG